MYVVLDAVLYPVTDMSLIISYDLLSIGELSKTTNDKQLLSTIESLDADCLTLEVQERLAPFRDIICTRIANDIEAGHISAKIIRRNFDGTINPTLTYIDNDQIAEWHDLYSLTFGNLGSASDLYLDYIIKLWDEVDDCASQSARDFWLKLKKDKTDDDDDDPIENLDPNADIESLRSVIADQMKENRYLIEQLEDRNIPVDNRRKRPHGNAMRHSSAREEILGAAVSCLTTFPEQCKSSNGNIKGAILANLIEEKALLFWPETGEPPVSTRKITEIVNSWINKTTH